MTSRQADLPPPAAIVLDLDGTLVDTVESRIRAWLATFAEVGIPVTRDQLPPLIGMDGRRLAREVASAAGIDLGGGRDEVIDRRSGEIYGDLNRHPRPLPEARELLLELDRRRVPWAIATSSRREQVATSIEALDLPRPPTIIDGSQVEHAKPAPDLLLRAAQELGVEPAETWCVGDSTWDMRAAVAAGMVPIGVASGAVDAEELRRTGARLTVANLGELIAALEDRQQSLSSS
jgi:beta-phosphoglucomutase-like phosphatase (HAD superfamily)